MSDCPHIHVQDTGLQAFRDMIREETGGGRDIVRFLKGAVNREYSEYEPHHELEASKILAHYGYEDAPERGPRHNASKPKPVLSSVEGRSSSDTSRKPIPRNSEDRDTAIDDFRDLIREETNDGLTIVRNLIHMMETREDPYKPQHNLAAAKELIYNGFPVTEGLLCSYDCPHHTVDKDDTPSEGSDAGNEEFVPDPGWIETLHEIKRMEDEGIIPRVEFDPFKPMYNWAPKEVVMPYAKEVAAKFRAELDLQAERRAMWPEIEERRRKKLPQIYPSHSEDEDPPDR